MTKDSLIRTIMGNLEAYVGHPADEWKNMPERQRWVIYAALNQLDNVVKSHIEGPFDYTKEG